MNIKTIGGLTGVVISLFAASQIGAELPLDYKNWPVQIRSPNGTTTYRTSEEPTDQSVREFKGFLSSDDGKLIGFAILGYKKRHLGPSPSPIEIYLKLDAEHADLHNP